jgi:hypothetical protein
MLSLEGGAAIFLAIEGMRGGEAAVDDEGDGDSTSNCP